MRQETTLEGTYLTITRSSDPAFDKKVKINLAVSTLDRCEECSARNTGVTLSEKGFKAFRDEIEEAYEALGRPGEMV